MLKSIHHSTLSYVGKRGLQNDFECMIKLALPIIKKGLTPTIFVNFMPIALTKPKAAPIPKTGVITPAIPRFALFAMLLHFSQDDAEAWQAYVIINVNVTLKMLCHCL